MKDLVDNLRKMQVELKAKKSSFNSFGGYYFRKAEDILEAVKPFIKEHNLYVTTTESVEMLGEHMVMKSVATISNGEDAIHATAVVAVDMDQKGMQMPQRFGAASSYAKKYALGNLFLIDDTADADATNNHGKGVPTAARIKPKTITDAQYKKAVEYIKGGGKVATIQAKYVLSKDQLKELNGLAKN